MKILLGGLRVPERHTPLCPNPSRQRLDWDTPFVEYAASSQYVLQEDSGERTCVRKLRISWSFTVQDVNACLPSSSQSHFSPSPLKTHITAQVNNLCTFPRSWRKCKNGTMVVPPKNPFFSTCWPGRKRLQGPHQT